MIGFLFALWDLLKIMVVLVFCVGIPLTAVAWLLLTIFVGDAKIDLSPIVKFLEKK